jgi:hypothetical protein
MAIRNRKGKGYFRPYELKFIRVNPTLHRKIQVAATAEGIGMGELLDIWVTRYLVERGLEYAAAEIIAHAEAASETREQWAREVIAQYKKSEESSHENQS